MNDTPGFIRRPEPVLFREKVERDLSGRASSADRAVLDDPKNLLRWYRVLVRMSIETEDVIARDNAKLDAASPEVRPALKRELAAIRERRTNFLKHLKARKSEIKDRLGHQPFSMQSVGDVLAALVAIQERLSQDDVSEAEGVLFGLIGNLRKDQTRVAALGGDQ